MIAFGSKVRAAIISAVAATAIVTTTVCGPAKADAATDQQWEALAGCESGHRWHINTGNGYYGGLQFSDRTWDAYRNGQYAHRADLAERWQQITVAERVLKVQGWGAWPYCSRKLGYR